MPAAGYGVPTKRPMKASADSTNETNDRTSQWILSLVKNLLENPWKTGWLKKTTRQNTGWFYASFRESTDQSSWHCCLAYEEIKQVSGCPKPPTFANSFTTSEVLCKLSSANFPTNRATKVLPTKSLATHGPRCCGFDPDESVGMMSFCTWLWKHQKIRGKCYAHQSACTLWSCRPCMSLSAYV